MSDEERREDLFEDLDRFFAPIRDVDWPEDRGPARERPAEPDAPSRSEDRPEPRVELPMQLFRFAQPRVILHQAVVMQPCS
mgnify:CR=1 FL=1